MPAQGDHGLRRSRRVLLRGPAGRYPSHRLSTVTSTQSGRAAVRLPRPLSPHPTPHPPALPCCSARPLLVTGHHSVAHCRGGSDRDCRTATRAAGASDSESARSSHAVNRHPRRSVALGSHSHEWAAALVRCQSRSLVSGPRQAGPGDASSRTADSCSGLVNVGASARARDTAIQREAVCRPGRGRPPGNRMVPVTILLPHL